MVNNMSDLVCKCCGYIQKDAQTKKVFKKRFAFEIKQGAEMHDLPYYCGACLDTVSDDMYYAMMAEMRENM